MIICDKLNQGSFTYRSIETSWKKCRTASPAVLFDNGNYTTVALRNESNDWRTHASLGLIGKTEDALVGLDQFDHKDARFYKGVTHWIGGNEKRAQTLLETVDTDHARRLLALIQKKRIHVLSQFAWQEGHPTDFTVAAEKDNKFSVRNIGFDSRHVKNIACADVHEFIPEGLTPDFYFSHMMEWHYFPINLHSLNCPKFGHTSDYDYCYHTSYLFLNAFDGLIVSSGEEWEDVSALVSAPVSTFPKSFSVPDFLEDIPVGDRQYDVFFSGSTIEPIFCEKARLIHEVAAMDNVNIRMINGFLPMREYYKALGNAKVALTYYRRPGGTVTRGLDALSMGCAALVQPKSVLRLFLDERTGLFSYDFEKNDIRKKVKQILDHWNDLAEGVRKGGSIIRYEFDKTRVVSQYLRYLTFLAAKTTPKAIAVNGQPVIQKRLSFTRGLPCPEEVRKSVRETTGDRLERLPEAARDYRWYINSGRDRVMEIADAFSRPADTVSLETHILIRQTLAIYRVGMDRFPESLVLRFNFIRAALHFGASGDIDEALAIAEDTVSYKSYPWAVFTKDDVFSWDFLRFYFDYKTYFDFVLISLTDKQDKTADLCRIIRASLYNYLSFYNEPQVHSKKAVQLNGEFPFYRLRLAALLSESPRLEDQHDASLILMDLADHSYLFREAYDLLCKNHGADEMLMTEQGRCIRKKMDILNAQFTGSPGFEGYGQCVNVYPIDRFVNLERVRAGVKDHVS